MNSERSTDPARPARRRLLQGTAAALALAPLGVLAQAPSPSRTLRIGHQKGYLSLLKGRGTLETRLAPLGVAVRWIEFTAGPVQLEALNVGSIDFGDVGEAPPIFAQAAGAPLAYVAATVPRPATEAVLVPSGSALRTVADLRGRRIALNKGSNVHYFLVKLLEKHGLRYADVEVVFLPPADARAAFERGAVDAWVIWDPFLGSAQHALGARILADAEGVANNRGYYFSSKDYVQRHADVLRLVVEEIGAVDRWAASHREAFATELATLWGAPRPATDRVVARWRFGTVPVTRAILAEQQGIADTFLALRLIPRRIDILDAAAPGLA